MKSAKQTGDRNMNRRMIVLVAILSIIMIASGCGSGGGSGRYTIPPEIPTPGTGGGTGGGGTGETDIASLILSGWEDFKYGAYSSAINKFNQAITSTGISDTDRIKAYNGLGWALTKSSGSASSLNAFTQAATGSIRDSDEAKIGLAAAHIQIGTGTSYSTALTILEGMGLSNNATTFSTSPDRPIDITNAEAHAMLAWCYYWVGNVDEAVRKINFARSTESSTDTSVGQIFTALKTLDPNKFK